MLAKNISGIMSGRLTVTDTNNVNEVELLKQINTLGQPTPLQPDDVYIRSCRLAGDAIDSQMGRFRTEDMKTLLDMCNGAPFLIGHDKSQAPTARFFGGELVHVDGVTYIAPKFYWMRNHTDAENIRLSIDGGIWSELSIGFTFGRATCSICGEDIRRCEHMPGQLYEDEGCFLWYDNIMRVNEGSVVYRGAQPGTGFQAAMALHDEIINKKKKSPPVPGGDRAENLQNDKNIGGDGLEFTEEQLTELNGLLGVTICSYDDIKSVAIDYAAQQKLALSDKRAAVMSLAVRKQALSGVTELDEKTRVRIETADLALLDVMADMYEADLAGKDDLYHCPNCGEVVSGLRVSAPEGDRAQDRGVDLGLAGNYRV